MARHQIPDKSAVADRRDKLLAEFREFLAEMRNDESHATETSAQFLFLIHAIAELQIVVKQMAEKHNGLCATASTLADRFGVVLREMEAGKLVIDELKSQKFNEK